MHYLITLQHRKDAKDIFTLDIESHTEEGAKQYAATTFNGIILDCKPKEVTL